MLRFGPKGKKLVNSFLDKAESPDLTETQVSEILVAAYETALPLSLQKTDRIYAPITDATLKDHRMMNLNDPLSAAHNSISCRS